VVSVQTVQGENRWYAQQAADRSGLVSNISFVTMNEREMILIMEFSSQPLNLMAYKQLVRRQLELVEAILLSPV
jgi:hypothetical protein